MEAADPVGASEADEGRFMSQHKKSVGCACGTEVRRVSLHDPRLTPLPAKLLKRMEEKSEDEFGIWRETESW